ncbi:MAG: ABC transporter ATP-binding protein [Gammaproteobacteria bacterium]|nr:ABC transporter ATP-binding protein [Gammaproteobacteria bacterium]
MTGSSAYNTEGAQNSNRIKRKDRIISPKIVLKAEQLSKQVTSPEGSLTILDRVDLSVSQGESVAVVGVSGAGKSTLLGLLAGLDVPSSGKVWLDGHELSALDEDGRAAIRADKVGFVFQSFHLVPSLTALENVMLPLELGNHPNARVTAREAIDRVGLTPRAGHYPRQLSGGEKQRVAIARAFVIRPSVLFADEPTGNLDHKTGENIVRLIFRLNHEADTTLVLVTHDLKLAQRCDRILHMDAGSITGIETPERSSSPREAAS